MVDTDVVAVVVVVAAAVAAGAAGSIRVSLYFDFALGVWF